jgi:hypothetical protein
VHKLTHAYINTAGKSRFSAVTGLNNFLHIKMFTGNTLGLNHKGTEKHYIRLNNSVSVKTEVRFGGFWNFCTKDVVVR